MAFSSKAFTFLAQLERNNEKAWFEAHRDEYEAHIRAPALEFIEACGAWFDAQGLPYVAQAKKAGGSLGRIHRDVRFSKDKSPYNTHVHMGFHHQDATEERPLPGIGVWWDSSAASVGAGCWMGGTAVLGKVRDAIVADPDGWRKAKANVSLEHKAYAPPLKTAPRGYDRDHPLIDDLKRTTFACDIPMTKAEFTTRLMPTFQASVRKAQPFVGFLEKALA